MFRPFVTFALTLLACVPAIAERVTVDPPMKLLTYRADRTEVAGQLVAYDENEFEIRSAGGETKTVAWDELEAKSILQVHTRLLAKGTGDQWMSLGERLIELPNGKAPAEKAFATAIKLEPALKARAETARKNASAAPAPAASPTDMDEAGRRRGRNVEEENAPTTAEAEPIDPEAAAAGLSKEQRTVGDVQATYWGKQSPEAQTAAVSKLKSFAAETKQRINPKIVPYETEFFLLYTDLREREAARWAGELDRMYARLCELFALNKKENIWRGKALVFIFSKEEDYHGFCQKMHGGSLDGTAGVCFQMGDGFVHIAFFRQPNESTFAHVLVHESVHGFLHRYKSPERIPTWANEGLAEVIAYELIPERGRQQLLLSYARDQIRSHGGVGRSFFDADHIEGWQYPIAHSLCEFMIRDNMKGYVKFIDGIKGGMEWEQSLKKNFGATREQLVPAYANSLGVKPQQLKE